MSLSVRTGIEPGDDDGFVLLGTRTLRRLRRLEENHGTEQSCAGQKQACWIHERSPFFAAPNLSRFVASAAHAGSGTGTGNRVVRCHSAFSGTPCAATRFTIIPGGA